MRGTREDRWRGLGRLGVVGVVGVVGSVGVGIEAAMWAETVADESELDFMLLPRLPGVAERAWCTGPGAPWAEYRWRLAGQRTVWQARGWGYFASSLVPWRPTARKRPTRPDQTGQM